MCNHCEKIVEDVQHKETVHKFMQAAADGVNRSLAEQGRTPMHPVTPNDIEVLLNVTATYWKNNFTVTRTLAENVELRERVNRLLYNDIIKAVE